MIFLSFMLGVFTGVCFTILYALAITYVHRDDKKNKEVDW